MNPTHPDARTLQAFVRCELDDEAAAGVALHLDGCPACAAWASSHDPLAAAFASVDDPLVPPDLLARILAESARPRRPGPEPLIAALLLGLAASLLLVGGGPARALSGAAVVLGALSTTAQALLGQGGLVLLLVWVASATAMLVAMGLTVGQLEHRRLT